MSVIEENKRLALYSSMVVSFLMHEITAMLVKIFNLLIKAGKYSQKDAKDIIKKALRHSLAYFEEHEDVYPEGMGRGSRGVELFLEQFVAPLNEVAITNENIKETE